MKKVLKGLGLLLLGLLLASVIAGWIAHRPLPEGIQGPQADALAEKMLAAVDKEAWDSTAWVQWTLAGRRHFLWDKQRNLVQVRWGNKTVLLNADQTSGKAFVKGKAVPETESERLVQKAWAAFCNDAFWLNPVVKVFDPGTERRLVAGQNGRDALLVTYTSGGVTPGDSYLWLLGEDGRPEAWRMWVSIVPIGGLKFTWESWEQLAGGAWVATLHQSPLFKLRITDLKAGSSWQDFGLQEDPFVLIVP